MKSELGGIGLVIAVLILNQHIVAQQRTDADLDAQGQVALEQYHDCARARGAFEQESLAAQTSPVWLDHVARASECAGDLTAALKYYDLELQKLPDTPRLIQKVGDLRYKQQLQFEQQQQKSAADQAAARQREQQTIHDASELQAARGRIDQDLQKLSQLFTADFKYDSTIEDTQGEFSDTHYNNHILRSVTQANECSLSFVNGKGSKATTIQLPLAGASAELFFRDDGRYKTVESVDMVLVRYHLTGSPQTSILSFQQGTGKGYDAITLINELGRACAP